jgi:hypothetical protein
VDLQHGWFNEHYLSLLSRYPVLDYSARNRDALEQIGIHHARLLEIGYSAKLSRIPTDREKDIDVLFYGAVSKRRALILEEAKRRGLRLVTLFGVYGEERDAAIARAKVVLNMRQHRTNIFETVRISYLLANQACVVSEGDEEDPDVQPFLGGLEVVPYDLLVDRCLELVGDDERRAELARVGFDRIRARPQSHLLAQCMLPKPALAQYEAEPERIVISNKAYGAEQVSADGVHFIGCSFEGTTVAYRGGAAPIFENCRLNGVNFNLGGPAMNTAAFLKMLMDQKIITGL